MSLLQSANVQSLSSQLIEYESDLKYETAKKEEILGNLHGLDKVYQQLQEDFDRQAKSLVEAQSETERLQMKLTKKEEELTRLLSHQQERKASMSRVRQLHVLIMNAFLMFDHTLYSMDDSSYSGLK